MLWLYTYVVVRVESEFVFISYQMLTLLDLETRNNEFISFIHRNCYCIVELHVKTLNCEVVNGTCTGAVIRL